jgi:hypothetical protein
MSSTLEMIRTVAGSALNFLMDDYTITTDPMGTDPNTLVDAAAYTLVDASGNTLTDANTGSTSYSCRGVVSDDLERHRDQGLVVETGERVIIILQSQSATLTEIQPGDWIEGPTNDTRSRSEKSVIKSIVRDPADATWMLAVAP